MVTNSLSFIDQADLIIVLDRGEICECGTFMNLVSRQGPFSALVQEHLNKKNETEDKEEVKNEIIEEDIVGK